MKTNPMKITFEHGGFIRIQKKENYTATKQKLPHKDIKNC